MRGYMHFLLVNLYGQPYTKEGAKETKAIPLKLTLDLEEIPTRNTVEEVYNSILSDIENARQLITKKSGNPVTIIVSMHLLSMPLNHGYTFIWEIGNPPMMLPNAR